MSKIVSKLAKLAVVLSTLAVLGSMTVLPVAYANKVIGQPDPKKYCANHGYQYSPAYNECVRTREISPGVVSLNEDKLHIPTNSVLCSEEYPGSKFQVDPFGCVRA
jgi:hypothetical protein